jgi:sulfatase modifying factor 1
MNAASRFPNPFPPSFASAWGDDAFGLWAEFRKETLDGESVVQNFRWIEPGAFLMGSPVDEPERLDSEGPQHEVTISHGFWLADTACTQALWQAVMGDNPSYFKDDPQQPVEQVSWHRVQNFLRELEKLLPGCRADLLSEAEWEYACRAGTTTPFSFGANINPQQVNYVGDDPLQWRRERRVSWQNGTGQKPASQYLGIV